MGMKRWAAALCIALELAACGAQAETIEAFGLQIDTQDTVLDLGKVKVEDFDLLREVMRAMPNLTRVDMYNTRMEKDVMASLTQEFPDVRFGWTLRAGPYRIRTDEDAFSTLRSPDEKPRYGSKTYEVLRYCPDMLALDLGHNKITDVSFLTGMPHLRYLILADNDVSDLTPLESLQELEYLELFMNEDMDLTPLTKLPNLTDLNLCQMTISDISPLYDMPQLKRLWISRHKPAFTEEEMQALREALPDCEINFTSASCTGEGWRHHPRYYPVRDTFRKGEFIPWSEEQRSYQGVYPYEDAPGAN